MTNLLTIVRQLDLTLGDLERQEQSILDLLDDIRRRHTQSLADALLGANVVHNGTLHEVFEVYDEYGVIFCRLEGIEGECVPIIPRLYTMDWYLSTLGDVEIDRTFTLPSDFTIPYTP